MKRIFKLFLRNFEISTNVMLVYRSNIVFFLIFETMFLLAQFITIGIGFDLAGGQIAGWTKEQAFLLTAINGVSHQLFICFFINPIFSTGMWVWNGQLDYVLLKPMPPLVSMWINGQFVISNLPNLLFNLIAVVYFVAMNTLPASPWAYAAFPVFVGAGLVVRVALALLCIAPVFLSERLADVEDSFWALSSLGRFPMSVYPRAMETFLTFVIPIAMLASVPASVVFDMKTTLWLAGALVASGVFAFASGKIFMAALGRYQSVNSGV